MSSRNTAKGTIRPAAISTDIELQDALAGLLADVEMVDDRGPLRVTVPAGQMDAEGLTRLDESGASLVFVDLGPDHEGALELTRALTTRDSKRPVILLGPSMDTELVLAGMRAGASEYLSQPLDPESVARALSRLTDRGPKVRTELGRCIGLFGGKGGSGVTTVAANLAVVINQATGGDVLLMDLDEFGTAGLLLGLWPRYSFHDVIDSFHRLDADLFDSMVETHESGVHLLAAPSEASAVMELGATNAAELIQFAKGMYDFVVVDFGRNGPAQLAPGIAQLDEALMVVTPEFPSVRNMKRVISVVESNFQGQPDQIHLVLNRETQKSNITATEIETTLGYPIAWSLPREDSVWEQAADVGRPLVSSASSSKSAKQIRAMGSKLAGPVAKPDLNGKGGLRKKLEAFVRRPRA